MATRITTEEGKPRTVTREIPGSVRAAPLMVTLAPEGIYFREKGRRTKYLVPYGMGKLLGARLYNEEKKREHEALKKARRAAR